MAARVTATEVKEVLNDSTLLDAQVDPYILSATTLVDATLGTGTTAILKEIERWLAAHMITITRERQAKSEGAGGASIVYSENFGEGLKATTYGQMVLTLDTTGLMASLGGRQPQLFAVPNFD
jgi:hypothetical protein